MPLTASPADQALLLDLQKLDTTLQQVAHRLANLPEIAVLSTLEGDTARLRSRLASEHGAWEDAQTELRRVESDVSLVETRIARDEQRLAGSSSSKRVIVSLPPDRRRPAAFHLRGSGAGRRRSRGVGLGWRGVLRSGGRRSEDRRGGECRNAKAPACPHCFPFIASGSRSLLGRAIA